MILPVVLAAVLAQVTPPVDKPKGRVEGRVVSAVSGEALRKATLRLRLIPTPGAIQAGNMPQMPVTIVASTDGEGKFVFEDVDPGRYQLSAERSGFVNQTYSTRSRLPSQLTVDSGQQIKDIVMRMTPQAVISGKVTDADGDPVPGTMVQVLKSTFNGRGRQVLVAGNANANPDGTFMVGNLAAGRYFVSAMSSRQMVPGRERSGSKEPQVAVVTTYYPNATELASAVAIDVSAGQDLRAIDIRLHQQRVYSVRGRLSGDSVANVALMLIQKGNETLFAGRQQSIVRDKEGNFEFHGLVPGVYTLVANPNARVNGEAAPQAGVRMEISVGDRDIEDLLVPLSPLATITGMVKLDDAPAPSVSVNMFPAIGVSFGPTPNGQSAADGALTFKNAMPDKYRVNVFGLPDGAYLKSIRFGSQDVTHGEIDLTNGAGGMLEVQLSSKAGDISGVVRDANGSAANSVLVSVWLPGDPFEQPRTALSDQNGAYRIKNLAPGDYKVIAWEDIEAGLQFDPDFRKRFESQAAAVSVKESSHESVELKMVPKDAIDAEAAKVK